VKTRRLSGVMGAERRVCWLEGDAEAKLRRSAKGEEGEEEEELGEEMLLSSPRATILTTPVSRRHL